MKSFKKLAQQADPVKSIRLWGKIYGARKDYYIAEVDKEAAAAEGQTEFTEPRGNPSSVNRFMYWVTDSVTSKWSDLPDVTPASINLARQINHIFTGEVEAEVISNPFFPWKEKVLLRAQIARITQSTTLTQEGLWKEAEDNPREIVEKSEEEKKQPPTFERLSKLEAWLHYVPSILNAGRTIHPDPEPPKEGAQEEDPEKVKEEMRKKDPFVKRLTTISSDNRIC